MDEYEVECLQWTSCLLIIRPTTPHIDPFVTNNFQFVLSTAATCPITKIPNSDKANGITGKLNDVVAVKCTGATNAFAVTCIAISQETAFWNGLVSCPGVF